METLNQLLQLFPYAVMGSILAGIICAFLGIFVNSQRSVFLGAVLTQVSIAGVAFSFLHFINLEALFSRLFGVTISETSLLHNLEPVLFSLLFAVITVLLFSQSYRQKLLTQDGLLGIIFVVAVALRIMFIQKSPAAEVSEIETILKGDILFIGAREFFILLIIMVSIVSIFVLFRKQLKFVTFDAESAAAHGFNSRLWLLVFYLVAGIGISLTTRFVGDVFAFAYLIVPSSIGIMAGRKIREVFLIAIAAGALLPPLSLYLAFRLDFSSGPMAVIISFILFMIVFVYKKLTA